MRESKLKIILDELYIKRSSLHLANDPVSFCHRFDSPLDQEVAAVIASAFAYGAVSNILKTLEHIFCRLGSSPRSFVEKFDPQEGLKIFSAFKHRFNDGRDLCALLWAVRLMIEDAGSVNNFFLKNHEPGSYDVTDSLNLFTESVLAFDYAPVFKESVIPLDSYFPFLFPAPASGSACKRLCMFLRWVVRPADGIDLGLWHGVYPNQLLIPVDTHIRRISGYLGFSNRKSADWKMAREITDALLELDHEDPVKYDFSLAHIGISEGCDGKMLSRCLSCLLSDVCRQSACRGDVIN